GVAIAWPLAARAQQQSMPVIGLLGTESPDLYADRLRPFRLGLRESGYVEGRNVAIEYRWAEGHHNRFPSGEHVERGGELVFFWEIAAAPYAAPGGLSDGVSTRRHNSTSSSGPKANGRSR